jgi:hypothetical protein
MMAATPEAISKIVAHTARSSAAIQLDLMMERGESVATMPIANTTFDAPRRPIEETKKKAEAETTPTIDAPRVVTKETAEAERKRLEDIIATLTANVTTLRVKAEFEAAEAEAARKKAIDEAAESRMCIARAEAQRVEALAVADAERLARVEAEARVTAAREEAERLKAAEEARKIAEIGAAKARAKAAEEDEDSNALRQVLETYGWW